MVVFRNLYSNLPHGPGSMTSTRLRPQSAATFTWQHVMAWRLRQHQLDRRVAPESMIDVVARLGGVQAQLISSAELALWARVANLDPDAVQQALWNDRSLVKTWAMRGTLHLLPASELQLWQVVPALDRRYLRASWLRYFGLSSAELERLTTAIGQVLDGQVLTRDELVDKVSTLLGSRELGQKLRHSWGMMLKPAAFRCQLCFGPSAGKNVRFTQPASWIGSMAPAEPDIAGRKVTRRFLCTYGPTTREVYAQWLGVSLTRAGALIQSLTDEVTPVDVEGTPAWALTSQLTQIAEARSQGVVRLVPAFDQYVIAASRDASHLLPGPFRDRVYRPQGWLSPVILVDGRMDGIWRHERKGGRLLVRMDPFVNLPGWAREAAEAEAERLATFMNRRLELTWI